MTVTQARSGTEIPRLWTAHGRDPLEHCIRWKLDEAASCEAPDTWRDTAASIFAQRYFQVPLGSDRRERSVRQTIARVSNTIAGWGARSGQLPTESDRDAFRDELAHLLVHQLASFNSPVWFNVGVRERPNCSACYVLSVPDSLEGLLQWTREEARVFARGGGAGVNLSAIREAGAPLDGSGGASGPLAFMRATDAWAGAMRQGGLNRAAKLVSLDANHPDILAFVRSKAEEEEKAHALAAAGFDVSPGSSDLASLSFQNSNHSVRIPDALMEAARIDDEWTLRSRHDGLPTGTIGARRLLFEIADAAWRCGDPGVQFDDTINRWNTTPAAGRINSSNPCSEVMHIDDSACNLASLNLLAFHAGPDRTVDVRAFTHAVDLAITAQDMLIDASSYPTARIASNSHDYRQLGLGFTNLGALLMTCGFPYDSSEGRSLAGALTALMTGRAYRRSAELAAALGSYPGFAKDRDAHLAVLERHRTALDEVEPPPGPHAALLAAARVAWDDAASLAEIHGLRNAQLTCVPPTGTTSLAMGCDTTGIEPEFALVKEKPLASGGQLTLVNSSVARALEGLGYGERTVRDLVALVTAGGDLHAAPELAREHRAIFAVASGDRPISPEGHVRMMAAVQPFVSGAISKSVNLPEEATQNEVVDLIRMAWDLGLKSIAVYRQGSKAAQVLWPSTCSSAGGCD